MAATTAIYSTMRRTAEQALTTPQGLEIYFRVGKYGSLEAAAMEARKWQIAFCSMRARERRQKIAKVAPHEKHMADPETQGRYDALSCSRLPLPDGGGWKVMLERCVSIEGDLEIVDIATGQPLSNNDPQEKKFKEIVQQFAHMRMVVHGTANKLYDPLTKEDRDWFVAYNWEWAYETYDHFGVVPNPVAAYADLRGQLPPEPKVVPVAAPYMAPQPVDNDHGPFKFSGVPVVTHNDPKLDPANIPEDVDIFSGLPLDVANPGE